LILAWLPHPLAVLGLSASQVLHQPQLCLPPVQHHTLLGHLHQHLGLTAGAAAAPLQKTAAATAEAKAVSQGLSSMTQQR
jgi:hypothetical protein